VAGRAAAFLGRCAARESGRYATCKVGGFRRL